MLVLSKKRIAIILFMICVSLYAFSFKISNNMIGEQILSGSDEKERTAQTVATPVSNRVVIVDAGHGTPDEGVNLLY